MTTLLATEPAEIQRKLEQLSAKSQLVQDNSGCFRVYRDKYGRVLHSVTSILSATRDMSGIIAWRAWQGEQRADQILALASARGTNSHDRAEYLLKTAKKVAYHAAKKRNSLRYHETGLLEVPSAITRWALAEVYESMPAGKIYSNSFAEPLCRWIVANVTQIYSIEYRVRYIFEGPSRFVRDQAFDGFAGMSDGLLGINGSGPVIVDWKTSNSRPDVDKVREWHTQLGGYRLGLLRDVPVEPEGGIVVCARRLAPVEVVEIDRPQLQASSQDFLDRCDVYTTKNHAE